MLRQNKEKDTDNQNKFCFSQDQGVIAMFLFFFQIVYMVRNSLARSNLAKKTLVDQRFLI